MKYEIFIPFTEGESIFAKDQITAVEACKELGQDWFFEYDSDNYPYSDIAWVWHIRGSMLMKNRLSDESCRCHKH